MSFPAPECSSTQSKSAAWAVSGLHWLVLLLVGAGIVSAFQVGKVPIALGEIRADLQLDLASASWLLSAFGLVGALIGLVIGLAVDHIGARRMVLNGLVLQAVACAAGAVFERGDLLLATRVVEGIGFLAVVVAVPAMIVSRVHAPHLGLAMAAWATFMPVGMTLVMFAAPFLGAVGWRTFWLVNAAALLGYAVLLSWATDAEQPSALHAKRRIRADIRHTLAAPGPWLLAGLFAAFCAAYFAVFGFLPSLLSERLGVSEEIASVLSGVAVVVSAVGNIVGGRMLARGVSHLRLLLFAFATSAVCSLGVFAPHIPGEISFALCIVFSLTAGTIPVALFQAAPCYAPRADLVGATVGMLMQGNNVGLVLGPAAAGFIASSFGWSSVSLLIVALGCVAFYLTWKLGRLEA